MKLDLLDALILPLSENKKKILENFQTDFDAGERGRLHTVMLYLINFFLVRFLEKLL